MIDYTPLRNHLQTVKQADPSIGYPEELQLTKNPWMTLLTTGIGAGAGAGLLRLLAPEDKRNLLNYFLASAGGGLVGYGVNKQVNDIAENKLNKARTKWLQEQGVLDDRFLEDVRSTGIYPESPNPNPPAQDPDDI